MISSNYLKRSNVSDGNKSGRHLSKIVAHIVAVPYGSLLEGNLRFTNSMKQKDSPCNTLEVSAANLWTYMCLKERGLSKGDLLMGDESIERYVYSYSFTHRQHCIDTPWKRSV